MDVQVIWRPLPILSCRQMTRWRVRMVPLKMCLVSSQLFLKELHANQIYSGILSTILTVLYKLINKGQGFFPPQNGNIVLVMTLLKLFLHAINNLSSCLLLPWVGNFWNLIWTVLLDLLQTRADLFSYCPQEKRWFTLLCFLCWIKRHANNTCKHLLSGIISLAFGPC